jgi:hypothetical protein
MIGAGLDACRFGAWAAVNVTWCSNLYTGPYTGHFKSPCLLGFSRQAPMPVIGFLGSRSPGESSYVVASFRAGARRRQVALPRGDVTGET